MKPSNLEARVLRGTNGIFWLEVYEEDGYFLEKTTFDKIERDFVVKVKHIIQLLDMYTKVSPSGRVFKEDVFDGKICNMELFVDARDSLCSYVMSLSEQSAEHYLKENAHTRRRKERRSQDVNTLLLQMRCPKISVKGIRNVPLLMEIFSFFAMFGRHLDICVSFEDLVVALLDRKYSSETAFQIHEKLLCLIKKGTARLCRYEVCLFFMAAADACIGTYNSEYDPLSLTYSSNWRRVKMTMRNWRKVLKMFFAYVCNELKVHKVAYFESFFDRSCKDIDIRMQVIKFLIECACTTSKLRRIVNSRIQGNWKTEAQDRYSLEESTLGYDASLYYIGAKCDIGCVDGVSFIFVENSVFFVRLGHVFQMRRCHIKEIVRSLAPRTHSHRKLIETLTAYIAVMEKRLCDII